MFNATLRRLAESQPRLTIHNNPFKAQKEWPPDFEKLHHKHKFCLERRYRRRSKLKWARPRWTKAVKLFAWGSSISVGVYGVLFMDWKTTTGRNEEPFGGIRQWFFGQLGSIWTTSLDTPPRPGIAVPKDDSSQDAKG